MIVNCRTCGAEFKTFPSRLNRGQSKYCSLNCRMPPMKGKTHTSSTRKKMSLSAKKRIVDKPYTNPSGKRGVLSPSWKGGVAWYESVHNWIKRQLGRPMQCSKCGTINSVKYEWANISGNYLWELDDWIRLCSKCHHRYDNISEKMWITRRKKV